MRLYKKIILYIFYKSQKIKKDSLNFLSTAKIVGLPIINQATLFEGKGAIEFENNVNLGFYSSPNFFDGSMYLEARKENAYIFIGENTFINNNCTIIADKSSISIGKDCLIGTNVQILNSDFHNLDPRRRNTDDQESIPIIIGNNVFIGNNARILKGVNIGDNSVIGNSSLVTKDIAANVVAAGIPAKVVKSL